MKDDITTYQLTEQEVVEKGIKALLKGRFSAVEIATFMNINEDKVCAEIKKHIESRTNP